MKSILLCENTLLKREGDTKNSRENSKDGQVEGKIKLNGIANDKKSGSGVPNYNSQKNENVLRNGKKSPRVEPSVVKVSENGKDKTAEELKNSGGEKCTEGDGESRAVTMKSNTSNNDKSEGCLKSRKNSLEGSENLNKNSKVRRGSSNLDSEGENPTVLSVMLDSFDEVCNEVSEVLIINDNERVAEKVAVDAASKNVENGFSSDDSSKTKANKNGQPLNEEIFDVDSNKENVKDEKTDSVEDLPKDGEEEGCGCEIQVEKVQSVSSQDPDFVWLPSDSEKSQQDMEETLEEKESEGAEDVYTCNEELNKSSEEEKETDCQGLVIIDSVRSEHVEGELEMEVEEADQVVEVNEEKKSEQTEWEESGSKMSKGKYNESKVCLTISKKRLVTSENDEDPSAKKMKLVENQSFEGRGDELKADSLAGVEIKGGSSKVEETTFEEVTEGKMADEEKIENRRVSVKEKEAAAAPTSSFLASFRGSLKNLTRSDLEELIVQKLCEVITERSNVGELRRKAQALEQDQERWKVKVQTLSKQMKEMEMVMKKYMSEVQKQLKDGTNPLTTPLRVTRSVGLQVSFCTYPNRGSKSNITPPANPSLAQTINTRNSKGSPRPPPQYTPLSQNLRSKSVPASPKSSPNIHKTSVTQERRHSATPNSAQPNRTTTATTPVTGRPVQAQVKGSRSVYKPVTGVVQQQQQQQQSQQLPQQQQGSKVIDLTEDDDQKTNSTGKSHAPTRVVSHLPQSGTPQSNRYTYLVPATSTSSGLGGTQNRQVLIATPAIQTPQQNRQIMCSLPPLLFKGGNQIHPTPQPQGVAQNNSRVILPKAPRHPAPLPQAPIRNWANMKQLPPRPALKISKVQTGIVLSWNMVLGPEHAPIRSYQLYAYQESSSPPTTSLWKKVGDVKALPLPMACTLTQFMSGHKYHFAVRAVDLHSRIGPFSFPGTIVLDKNR